MAEHTSYVNPLTGSPCGAEPGNNGNVAYIADNVNPGWTQSFTYDGLNRLATASRSDGGYNHTYNYDSFGNLLIQDNINPGPTYSINNATNQLNRINPVTQTSLYAYDAAGNLTSSDTSMGTGTSSIGGHTYTYNALSQITAVDGGTTASYIYNGEDQRAYKLTSGGWTDYLYFQGQPVAEQSHDATTGATEWTDYIYAAGQKIAKIATPSGGTSTTNYYLDDHLGTTQVELDASGNVTWQGQFTPFGTELPDGSTTMHYKFTSKERDTESGLDYFGARYYASSTGRWMSPDWAQKPEAVPYSSLGDPQSLNLYGYVGNNPLSKADADGHCWPQCTGFIASYVGNGVATYGVGGFAKEIGIGALKGVGQALYTAGLAVAAGGSPNPGATMTSGLMNMPSALQPSNPTQAVAALAANVATTTVMTVGAGGFASVTAAPEAALETESVSSTAFIVRGGASEMPATGTTFSASQGATLEEAAAGVPHGTIRSTTAGAIQQGGGTVESAPEMTRAGNMNNNHVNVTEGSGPSSFSAPRPNPVPKPDRIQ